MFYRCCTYAISVYHLRIIFVLSFVVFCSLLLLVSGRYQILEKLDHIMIYKVWSLSLSNDPLCIIKSSRNILSRTRVWLLRCSSIHVIILSSWQSLASTMHAVLEIRQFCSRQHWLYYDVAAVTNSRLGFSTRICLLKMWFLYDNS